MFKYTPRRMTMEPANGSLKRTAAFQVAKRVSRFVLGSYSFWLLVDGAGSMLSIPLSFLSSADKGAKSSPGTGSFHGGCSIQSFAVS